MRITKDRDTSSTDTPLRELETVSQWRSRIANQPSPPLIATATRSLLIPMTADFMVSPVVLGSGALILPMTLFCHALSTAHREGVLPRLAYVRFGKPELAGSFLGDAIHELDIEGYLAPGVFAEALQNLCR